MPSTPDSLLAALIDRAELDDIVCYGLAAQSAAGYPMPPAEKRGDADPEMVIRALLRSDGLTVRAVVQVYTTEVTLKVDIGAVYSIQHILDYSPQVIVRFIADSALPTIYPFVREMIADTSRRIGVEYYVIASLEPPHVPETILKSMVEDVARTQQAVIAEAGSKAE